MCPAHATPKKSPTSSAPIATRMMILERAASLACTAPAASPDCWLWWLWWPPPLLAPPPLPPPLPLLLLLLLPPLLMAPRLPSPWPRVGTPPSSAPPTPLCRRRMPRVSGIC